MDPKTPPEKQHEIRNKIYRKLNDLSERLRIMTLQVEALNKWVTFHRISRLKDKENKTKL